MGKASKRQEAEQAREYRLRRQQEEKAKQARQDRILLGILLGVLAVALVIAGIFGGISAFRKHQISKNVTPVDPSLLSVTEKKSYYVRLTVSYTTTENQQEQGDIILHLRPDVAPDTVKNFQSLVQKGFYDGLTFHRVYSGFMIQGGCPDGTGGGDAGYEIKGEFAANGVPNGLSHKRGVISMARGNDPDSASSQFFIMHADNTGLDGQYAAFGEVISGMETVDAIASVAVKSIAGSIDTVPTSPVHPVTILSAVFMKA